MDSLQEEALMSIRNDEYNERMEEKYSKQYDHNDHEPTTFERAQEEEQDVYERDDKMGAI